MRIRRTAKARDLNLLTRNRSWQAPAASVSGATMAEEEEEMVTIEEGDLCDTSIDSSASSSSLNLSVESAPDVCETIAPTWCVCVCDTKRERAVERE